MASTPSVSSRARSWSKGRGYRAKSSLGPNCAGLTNTVTITRWFSRRARATRLSWPAWSAPIVGTTPISSPAWRQATACSCMAFADSMTAALAGGVLVLRGGEGAATHVLVERARGGFDRVAEFGVLANELGDVVRIQAENILNDEHLPVAIGSGADADRWDAQRLRHPLAERARDRLQDDGKGARVFQRSRIGEDLLRRLIAAAL